MLKSYNPPHITALVSVSVIMAAAFLGGTVVFLISGADDAKAEPVTKVEVHQTLAKGDRLPALGKGASCSSRGWPYYEPSCEYDMRRPLGEMPTVRIVALR